MISPEDHCLIRAIAERAARSYDKLFERQIKPTFIQIEIEFVHEQIVPLRLADMLAGDEFDFMHDISGIHRHLELTRDGARLKDCFLPRFADLKA